MDLVDNTSVTAKLATWRNLLFPFALFALGFMLVTLQQSNYGQAIPGDMGDARFNLIILEHLHRWVTGLDRSLWSPEFFYPYPGALSFSDNHFGTGVLYIIPRLLGADPERAFIIWYSLAAPLNYLACYVALRKLSLHSPGSAVGAFIFAFALSASAQYGHAQLAYRFATPLAVAALIRFLENSDSRELLKLVAFITIQFFCSIYIGYFLSLFAAAIVLASYLIKSKPSQEKPFHYSILTHLCKTITGRDHVLLLGLLSCVALLATLFFPYTYYSHLYGFRRSTGEIFLMLPQPASYLLSDGSRVWHDLSAKFAIPMRWEHQMFFGASAIFLAILGGVISRDTSYRRLAAALIFLVLLTLNIHNHSLYRSLIHLPLADSIRAVSRICLVMLFPVALLAGISFDWLIATNNAKRLMKHLLFVIGGCLLVFMIYEYSTYSGRFIPVKVIQDRWATLMSRVPHDLQKDVILYVPDQFDESTGFNELDGMRLGQILNLSTLNGYSGNAPVGFTTPLSDPCQKVNQRLADYSTFAKHGEHEFTSLVNRVYILDSEVPCSPDTSLLHRTHFSGELSPSTMKNVAISIQAILQKGGHLFAQLRIENHSGTLLAPISDDNHPIHASWRYVPAGAHLDSTVAWDQRSALAADLFPGGSQVVEVSLDAPKSSGLYYLEASLVQEGVSWFQTAGMPIARSTQLIKVEPDASTSVVNEASASNAR